MTAVLVRQSAQPSRLVCLVPDIERASSDESSAGDELWVLAAALAFGLALLVGYGAFDQLYDLKPSLFTAAEMGLLAVMLSLCPRGRITRLTVSLPALAFTLWWMASYFWSSYEDGFLLANLSDGVTVLTIVLAGSLMPLRSLIRCIITVGYIAIGLVFVAWVVQPGLAFTAIGPGSAVPGLHGAFVHKNGMTPCLLVTAVAVVCFERRVRARVIVLALVLVMVVLSQSSTALIALAMVIGLNASLKRFAALPPGRRRGLGPLILFVTIAGVFLAITGLADIAAVFGKDVTFSGRDKVWERAFTQISHRPWQGFGGGSWGLVIAQDPGKSINRDLGYVVRHSHNGAIEMMVRLGIVGLLLYLCVFVAAVALALKVLRECSSLARFSIAFLAIVFVFGMSEVNTVFGSWFALLVLLGTSSVMRPNAPVIAAGVRP